MAIIVTREVGATAKGSPLSNAEIDQNFINLNTEIDPALSYPSIAPSLLLDFANTKRLDPRVTFTRSSTATYYDGVTVAKAEENLLTYSGQFDVTASWTQAAVTVTANTAVAPDGTTSGDTIQLGAGTSTKWIGQLASAFAGARTYSFYAKYSTNRYIQFLNNGSTQAWANFDILNGVAGTAGSGVTSSITDAGNGWWRCVITHSIAAATEFRVYGADSNSAAWDASTTSTGAYFLWGAQLEQRSSVTAYTPTTTAAITNYVPQLLTAAAGVPRFDCNPTTGESLGLLIEEQRTNLCIYSEQLDNGVWSKSGTTVTPNAAVSPDGTVTADQVAMTSSAYIYCQNITAANTTQTYTASIWVKGTVGDKFGIRVIDAATGNGGSTVITIATDSWVRYTYAQSVVVTSGQVTFGLETRNAIVPGTGTAITCFAWGAQMEQGSFATSYIPTVASQVPRAADVASVNTLSPWYNSSAGTFFVEVQSDAPADTSRLMGFAAKQGASGLAFLYNGGNYRSGGVSLNLGFTQGVSSKYALAYTNGVDRAGARDGGAVLTSLSLTDFSLIDSVSMSNFSGAAPAVTRIKRFAYYPRRLTNTQLQAITG